MRWLWEEIDRAVSTVVLWIRGCQHPKTEPDGAAYARLGEDWVLVMIETCTVCGQAFVITD